MSKITHDNRITIILGAGAVFEATKVSTYSLTKDVLKACSDIPINEDDKTSLVELICRAYNKLYESDSRLLHSKGKHWDTKALSIISFEDIFHAIEMLDGFKSKGAAYGFNPVYKIFASEKRKFKKAEMLSVYLSASRLIQTLNDKVHEYDVEFSKKGGYFKHFFEELHKDGYKFDVYNLNYDTWVEQTLDGIGCGYNDGFVNLSKFGLNGYDDKFQRFDSEYYWNNEKSLDTVAHLHGQIKFEYPDFKRDDINYFSYRDSNAELYKYRDYEVASDYRKRSSRSTGTTQGGVSLFRTNIITGLEKTEKLLWTPMDLYHMALGRSLLENKRLIIIGYGFPDKYLNSLLTTYIDAHFKDGRVVVADKIKEDGDPWSSGSDLTPFTQNDKTLFLHRMFNDQLWYARTHWDTKYIVDGYWNKDKSRVLFGKGFRYVSEEKMDEVVGVMG